MVECETETEKGTWLSDYLVICSVQIDTVQPCVHVCVPKFLKPLKNNLDFLKTNEYQMNWFFNFPPEALHAEHRLLGRAEHCERLVVKLTLERKSFKTNRGWISPSDATPSPSCSCGSRRAGETSLTRASRLDKVRTMLGLKHLNPLDAEGF